MKQKRGIKNIAASVRQRLYNRASERGENFNLVVPRYAVERLLYRLSQSQYAKEFVLKGAQLFYVWTESPHRTTRDLDLLRYGNSAIPELETIFRNSRMKDFYDLSVLAHTFHFDGETLCRAIAATFKRRQIELPNEAPLALTLDFAEDQNKQKQWQGFLNKNRLQPSNTDLGAVIEDIRKFLMPPILSVAQKQTFKKIWIPGGDWRTEK